VCRKRRTTPVRRDQMPWDRIFMLAVAVVFIGWMVLIALDARRFGWPTSRFRTRRNFRW
jgi:hypothetical protein